MEQFVVKVALTAETKEMRHLNRVLRHSFAQYRRKWTPQTLAHLILKYFPENQAERNFLLSNLPAESIEVRWMVFVCLQRPPSQKSPFERSIVTDLLRRILTESACVLRLLKPQ
jgi:hypothetical protein